VWVLFLVYFCDKKVKMTTIVLQGWQEGLKKVDLSLLQVSLLKLPLREAKANVDSLLDNQKIYLTAESTDIATTFQAKATALGAVCYLEYEPVLTIS
jgi:hypothetical protein